MPAASGPDRSPEDEFDITSLLQRMSAGDETAGHMVWTSLLAELRLRARRTIGWQPPGGTLQATQLIGYAYERVQRLEGKDWKNREHFLAVATRAMHSALIDHLRRPRSNREDSDLDVLVDDVGSRVGDVLAFEEALRKVRGLDATIGRILEMRALGFNTAEIAPCVRLSERSVNRKLQIGRGMIHGMLA